MINISLFGYTGSGKTSLFQKLTGKEEDSFDPFKPNIGIGVFQDSRLESIAEILNPKKKKVFPEFQFSDLKGFPEGEGFPRGYFNKLDDSTLIVFVVDNFHGDADPAEQISSLSMELIFADIERIERILETREAETSKGKTFSPEQQTILQTCLEMLKKEKFLKNLSDADKKQISDIPFLTTREVMAFINGKEKSINPSISFLCEDVTALIPADFYNKTIESLSLMVFYTVKGDVAQAWVVPENIEAKIAAGHIHTDIEKGFIKAAVLHYKDIMEIGSWQKAKSLGVLKFLGPHSTISDGDVVEFYFHH